MGKKEAEETREWGGGGRSGKGKNERWRWKGGGRKERGGTSSQKGIFFPS